MNLFVLHTCIVLYGYILFTNFFHDWGDIPAFDQSYMTLMVYIPASICNSHDFTLNISMYI